jgi:hypothetical protein
MQFARLAKVLVARGHTVFVVDYVDGCLARNIEDPRIRLIPYEDGAAVALPDDTLAVFQTMTPWSIFPGLRPAAGTRLLFWTCHPFNLVPTVPGLRRLIQTGPRLGRPMLRWALPSYWSKVRAFLEILRAHRAIVFMDKGNLTNTERYLSVSLRDGELLPIPVAVNAPNDAPPASARAPLRVAWVGRVVDFKYHILTRAMERLDSAAAAANRPVRMTVVGDGDYLPRLERDARALRTLEVEFRGKLPPSAVAGFLSTEVDVLLAMGTAAIEGAALGIPTVLLDFSYQPVAEDYRFTWLHQGAGYSLGELIGSEHSGAAGSMLGLLNDVWSRFAALSREARDHVAHNHAVEPVCDRFLELAERSSCRWEHLQSAGVLQPGWLYRMHKSIRR